MARYLISVSIGPVQDFIAAARRTRDLWLGSNLLSEISKSTALKLRQLGGDLVFPSPPNGEALEPNSSFNVVNRLLAVCETDDPLALAAALRNAANDRWQTLANQARKKARYGANDQHDFVREDMWNQQADDVVEIYTAWAPYDDDTSYQDTRAYLETLVFARKQTRPFNQTTLDPLAPWGALPKSSLDAQRETVLVETIPDHIRVRKGIRPGEQLDCPGLVKRLAGEPDQFTPVSRIAIDPWVRRVIKHAPKGAAALIPINDELEKLVRLDADVATRVNGNPKGQCIYQALPFDAEVVFEPRARQAQLTVAQRSIVEKTPGAGRALQTIALHSNNLSAKPGIGRPCPYLALLLADGDHMGELLRHVKSVEIHRQISEGLAEFAAAVPTITREHHGHAIYAGGDDVLAFVPLDQALACARALSHRFQHALQAPATQIPNVPVPTLSVGLGIGHMLEPLGHLRAIAQRAEALAKGDNPPPGQTPRNALGIVIQPRSGPDVCLRAPWTTRPVERLSHWMALLETNKLPSSIAFHLRHCALELDPNSSSYNEVSALEAARIIDRRRAEKGAEPIDTQERAALIERVRTAGLATTATELTVARWLAQHVLD